MNLWDDSMDDDPRAVSLADEILDLIKDRNASVLEALTATTNIIMAMSIMLSQASPDRDAVVAISALTRGMVEKVRTATGHKGGSA